MDLRVAIGNPKVRICLIQDGRTAGRFCYQMVAGPKVFDLRRSLTEVYQDMVDSFVVMPSGPPRWSGGF